MKYEIGVYWYFKAGGKRKALPLLKKFIPKGRTIFTRLAKEIDHLGVAYQTDNLNDLDLGAGEDLPNLEAADEFDTYAIGGGEQYILENFTDTYQLKFVNVFFLRFANVFARQTCREKIIENVKVLIDAGYKCSYSEDMFRSVPSGIMKIHGETIEESMFRISDITLERNQRFIINHLTVSPEHALFKMIDE